jgi:beta-glucosidase-like glycosyl hydrolase
MEDQKSNGWGGRRRWIKLDFAPMVDVARDARWGRVMEGAGEDAFRK